jgi:voltage-gated potassium channel
VKDRGVPVPLPGRRRALDGADAQRRWSSTDAPARLRRALLLVMAVVAAGTVGYVALGLGPRDALYQTVTTITTVGFKEVQPFGTAEQWFTMVVIIGGVGTVLYTFTLSVQLVVEGQLGEYVGRRRMDRRIADMSGHVIVCGWGRVGRAVADDLQVAGRDVVVIDVDRERAAGIPFPTVVADATLDDTLRAAGITRAGALIAALSGDAENLFVTLSGRAMNPSLFIVARARQEDSVAKLTQAGANRVVNPQELGAARMASFVVQPHVAEFVDVVMHERSLEFRMQELRIQPGSQLAGRSLRSADLRRQANILVLALRRADGSFVNNPDPDLVLEPGQVIIALGARTDLRRLEEAYG